jgi:uncharacterized protein (UPF0212 family)
MARETIILDVDATRAGDLREALSKRDYINIVTLDRDDRKNRKACPACNRKLSREVVYFVTDQVLVALLAMLKKHAIAKAVVVTNKKVRADRLPPVELERAVDIQPPVLERAKRLGLVAEFTDGSRETHHLTAAAMAFLSNKAPLSPGTVVLLDGEPVDSFGEIALEGVRFKDRVRRDEVLKHIRRALKDVPQSVVEFIENGQMSLV